MNQINGSEKARGGVLKPIHVMVAIGSAVRDINVVNQLKQRGGHQIVCHMWTGNSTWCGYILHHTKRGL
jgi:hypothetical protein